jgi:hypothetical protein
VGASWTRAPSFSSVSPLCAILAQSVVIWGLMMAEGCRLRLMLIWDAARRGDLAEVKRVLGQHPGLLDAGVGGMTLLMFASVGGHVDVVRWLVDKGAGLNERA